MDGFKRGREEMVGGTKGEGLAPPLLFFPFWDLAERNPRVSCSWGVENSWREREKRERLGRKSFVFPWLNQTYTVHVYINTGSNDPNPKLP